MPNQNHQAAQYHFRSPQGKIATKLTKPCNNQEDLSLAYTPGVGSVCQEIADTPSKVYNYTNKGNTCAIICDGTAILGMGNIGPEAGLPVIEGKSVLFKKFADIDTFPLCLKLPHSNIDDPDYAQKFAETCASISPSVAAYNLEDIKAPQCFAIQEALEKLVKIPVFHDDQDGTAITIIAALLNALEIVKKDITKIKIVLNGAGAAGIAIVKLLFEFGVSKDQLWVCDQKGLITQNRQHLHPTKALVARDHQEQNLAETIQNADLFIGVSTRDLVSKEMAGSMAKDAIIFAVANPIPEIMPDLAKEAGVKIVGSGRSDYPNQINNSLIFPGLFRAVLDTKAKTINKEMRIAAGKALAQIAREPFPPDIAEQLKKAYPLEAKLGIFDQTSPLSPDYIIPKQFDLRVAPKIAHAVATAAIESQAATTIIDLTTYEQTVSTRISKLWE